MTVTLESTTETILKKNSASAAEFNKVYDYSPTFLLNQSTTRGYAHPKASVLIDYLIEQFKFFDSTFDDYTPFLAAANILAKELLADPTCPEKNILALKYVLETAKKLKQEPNLPNMQAFLQKEAEFHALIEPYSFLRRIRASEFSKILGDFAAKAHEFFRRFYWHALAAELFVAIAFPAQVAIVHAFYQTVLVGVALSLSSLFTAALFQRSTLKEYANHLTRSSHSLAEKLMPEDYKKTYPSTSAKLTSSLPTLFAPKVPAKKPAPTAPLHATKPTATQI